MRCRLSELLKLSLADFRQSVLAQEREWTGRTYHWYADGEERGSITVGKDREGLRLSYARGGESITQHIALRYLPRHFGGYLVVAVCPGCWRPVRVLYFRRAFYCNRCTRAVYTSSSQDKARGAQTQYQKLRERVRPGTWDAGIGYFPRRPTRMRRVTYNRLCNRAYAQLNRDILTLLVVAPRLALPDHAAALSLRPHVTVPRLPHRTAVPSRQPGVCRFAFQ